VLISQLTRLQANQLYEKALKDHDAITLRRLCLEDLFFLLVVGLKRKDANRDWIYDRCREVQANPDGYLDLWAREHYKSTVITLALTIQDILKNPEVTVGIFSHTRPIAKSFLSQIKRELESNDMLKDLFPDILYKEPHKDSPCWSLDSGIVVKRKSNPKECTVEAWGLVDGQPTSKHFSILVYDDVVTRESVTTPDQIAKVTDAWALSLNLGAEGGKRRYIGTRYHANDTYKTVIDRGSAKARIYPATHDGKHEGIPVLMSREVLADKRRDMGPYIFASQMLQNPMADNAMGFKTEWLQFYNVLRKAVKWNYYVLVDAANEKKKTNDYTVMVVIALGPDNNYYLVDGIRDRINLTERTNRLFEFVRKWQPVAVGYEKYGKDSDIEHIQYVQEEQGYRFPVIELGGSMPKNDRIRRLVPIFEQRRFYLPNRLLFVSQEGKAVDFIQSFLKDEYESFPVCTHDDMLDCMARIVDDELAASFPKIEEDVPMALPEKKQEINPFALHANLNEQVASPQSPYPSRSWREMMTKG